MSDDHIEKKFGQTFVQKPIWEAQWLERSSTARFGYEFARICRENHSLDAQREEVSKLMSQYSGDDIAAYKNVLAQLMGGTKIERDYSMKEQVLWAEYVLEPIDQKRLNGEIVKTTKYQRRMAVAERHKVSEKTVEAAVAKMERLGFKLSDDLTNT
jgi:hypothetical protein